MSINDNIHGFPCCKPSCTKPRLNTGVLCRGHAYSHLLSSQTLTWIDTLIAVHCHELQCESITAFHRQNLCREIGVLEKFRQALVVTLTESQNARARRTAREAQEADAAKIRKQARERAEYQRLKAIFEAPIQSDPDQPNERVLDLE